jgi:stage III sporulation protein AB
MILRIITVIFIVLCSAFIGIERSEELKKRISLCDETKKLFGICENMIRSSGADLYRLISRLKQDEFRVLSFINDLPEAYSPDAELRDIWERAVEELKDIPQEEKSLLAEFGRYLGTTDITGQVSFLASQSELISLLRVQRAEEYRRKGRLYRSVGLMAGLMIGIIII